MTSFLPLRLWAAGAALESAAFLSPPPQPAASSIRPASAAAQNGFHFMNRHLPCKYIGKAYSLIFQ